MLQVTLWIYNVKSNMKTTILSIAMAILLFAACNSGTKKTDNTGTSVDTSAKAGTTEKITTTSGSTKEVVTAYLELKNALTQDNDKNAAQAGNSLFMAIAGVDKASLTAGQSKVFTDVADDAKEHAEHIGANAGNIKHQREHFETLSQEIYDLVKAGGSSEGKLYYDNCPMYNDGKGGNWISETKEILNPYLGKAMPTCGSLKEELN
jgi:ABC-type Fe3+-hydroxamate transport system substrate-binding protein